MTTETEQTGATDAQIDEAVRRQHPGVRGGDFALFRRQYAIAAQYLVPPDQCIVPRSFIAAVDAAIDAAEELDYSTPAIRIPLGRWHDVENARDTFREGTS